MSNSASAQCRRAVVKLSDLQARALNTGGLSRLTGCWHDSYYADRYWSNVACIDRGLQHTHRKMQQLSGFA